MEVAASVRTYHCAVYIIFVFDSVEFTGMLYSLVVILVTRLSSLYHRLFPVAQVVLNTNLASKK